MSKPSRTRQVLKTAGPAAAALLAGGAALTPVQAAVLAESAALQARVEWVRTALAQRDAQEFGAVAQSPNWTNWPKWTKWANWANK